MSRHRNVRSMNYSDEYDGFDDEYGHSVEDDFCISPSDAAQFMYDRNRQSTQISAFFNESENIAEEDEDENNVVNNRRPSDTFQKPQMSELEEARLQSCLDEIRNVIGDTVPDNIIIETVLTNNFDLSKSLDALLSYESSASKSGDPKPQRERKERNRDDDFSDYYSSLQSSLNQYSENITFSICSNTERPHPEFCGSSELLLDHFPVASNYRMVKNKCSSDCMIPFHNSSKKLNPKQNIHQNTQTLSSSDTAVKELPSDLVTPVSSNSDNQLKFHVPRLQKPRKDSDKENIAEQDDSDSEDLWFSSLSALAKQYSSVNFKTPEEKEIKSPETKKPGIIENVLTDFSFSSCSKLRDFSVENKQNESLTGTFTTLHSKNFDSAFEDDSLIDEQMFEQYSSDEEKSFHKRIKPTLENEKNQLSGKILTLSEKQFVEKPEVPLVTTLSENKQESLCCFTNNGILSAEFLHPKCSPELWHGDKDINLIDSRKDPSSLSEIVNDHLYKSVSNSNNLHVTGNFDVMKSESCPQFVIPRLHVSQKRRGVSECLPDESQDEKSLCDFMNRALGEKDNDTDNWVIDLKSALKSVQRESVVDSSCSCAIDNKNCDPNLLTDDKFFIPNLPCLLNLDFPLEEKCILQKSEPSAFGKVLCRKWKIKRVKNVHHNKESPKTVRRFTFTTPSPDDNIMAHLTWN